MVHSVSILAVQVLQSKVDLESKHLSELKSMRWVKEKRFRLVPQLFNGQEASAAQLSVSV